MPHFPGKKLPWDRVKQDGEAALPARSWSSPADAEAQNHLPMGQSSVVPLPLLERTLLVRARGWQRGPHASCIPLVLQPSRSMCNLGKQIYSPFRRHPVALLPSSQTQEEDTQDNLENRNASELLMDLVKLMRSSLITDLHGCPSHCGSQPESMAG